LPGILEFIDEFDSSRIHMDKMIMNILKIIYEICFVSQQLQNISKKFKFSGYER